MGEQHIIDIKKIDIENVVYVKPRFFGIYENSLGVYYRLQDTKKKIIIRTPKMIAPFGIKKYDNKNYIKHQISLSFASITSMANETDLKIFHNFVNTIDDSNKSIVKNNLSKWKLSQNLKFRKSIQNHSRDYPPYINCQLPIDSEFGDCFSVYDESGKRSNLSIISNRSIVSAIVELTDIRFTETDYFCTWNIISIRKHKPYSLVREQIMNKCLLFDTDEDNDSQGIEDIPKIIQPQAIQKDIIPAPPLQKPIEPRPSTGSGFKPPSLFELQNAIGCLKSVPRKAVIRDVPEELDDCQDKTSRKKKSKMVYNTAFKTKHKDT